jgi:cytochrome c-type biogenesis protein CcmH/NrfG
MAKGRADDAMAEYREAPRLDPRYADAASGPAAAYSAKGMQGRAQAANKAAELKKSCPGS